MHFPRAAATTSGDTIHTLPEHAGLAATGLLPDADPKLNILFGEVVIPVDSGMPAHRNSHPEAFYLLSGTVRVWRPGGSVELIAPSAAYIPAGEPHSVENIGDGPATLLVAFATGLADKTVTSTFVDYVEFESDTNPNLIPFATNLPRWVSAADTPPWIPVEPSKGMKLRCKMLLDGDSGTPDFVIGLAHVDPHLHYTIHRHEPAEIYYVLAGHATIWVGDEGFEVGPGDTVYVPAWAPHGIDTGDEDLEMYWFYSTDTTDSWAWEPLEPVYSTPPRRPLETGPARGFHNHS